MLESTLLVPQPYARPTSGSSLAPNQTTSRGTLGCDPAYGPPTKPKSPVLSSDEVSSVEYFGMTLVDNVVG